MSSSSGPSLARPLSGHIPTFEQRAGDTWALSCSCGQLGPFHLAAGKMVLAITRPTSRERRTAASFAYRAHLRAAGALD